MVELVELIFMVCFLQMAKKKKQKKKKKKKTKKKHGGFHPHLLETCGRGFEAVDCGLLRHHHFRLVDLTNSGNCSFACLRPSEEWEKGRKGSRKRRKKIQTLHSLAVITNGGPIPLRPFSAPWLEEWEVFFV